MLRDLLAMDEHVKSAFASDAETPLSTAQEQQTEKRDAEFSHDSRPSTSSLSPSASSPANAGEEGQEGSPSSSSPSIATPFVSALPPPPSFIRGYFMSETPWAALHTRPTVLTILISMCVFLPVTLVLQRSVVSTTAHLVVFFVGSCVVLLGYYIAYRLLSSLSSSFGRLSRDKQIYAVSNLLKASVLASITPIAAYQLTLIVWYDHWDTNTLRNLGCLYAVPDFVSLLAVRRMAATTIVHHVCVVLFNFFSIQNDYTQDNVCRLIVVYGAFSTFGYVVYLLLASRFLFVSSVVSRHLSVGALVVYVVCCGINWAWQASYLRRLLLSGEHHVHVLVYMTAVSFVMWDDLTLNRWLLQNVRTRTTQKQQVAQSVLVRHADAGPIVEDAQCQNHHANAASRDFAERIHGSNNGSSTHSSRNCRACEESSTAIGSTTTPPASSSVGLGAGGMSNRNNTNNSNNMRHVALSPVRVVSRRRGNAE